MGLFEQLAGGLLGNTASNQDMQTNIVGSITNLIAGAEAGGLTGLVQTFKEKGLGDVVSSWVGTGENLPINADQVRQVLGSPQVQQIAQKLGVSTGDASQAIAQYLPRIVDKLTPNGLVPADDLVAQGLTMLKGELLG